MSEEVLCPYCNKALPPGLMNQHVQERRSRRPTVSRTQSFPNPGNASPSADADHMPPPALPLPYFRNSVETADKVDTSASKAAISEDDLKRWSRIAGINLPPKEQSQSPAPEVKQEETKAFPLLPPPPPPLQSKASGSRFGFFGRNKSASDMQDEESDSDDGVAIGYAKLGAPASDDEDDGYESEELFSRKPPIRVDTAAEKATSQVNSPALETPAPVVQTPIIVEPSISNEDLRNALREVLERVNALTRSHEELATSHSTLLTTVKISRSNLVMAEANTEMLEEELRRAKAAVARAQMRPTIETPSRTSTDHTHVRTPSGSILPGKETKSWFGMKRPSGTLPSPSTSEAGHTFRVSSDAPRSPAPEDEVKRLRAQLETQAAELETLKTGKKEIEAELEGLSQALFEEANKMVADERKRRAAVEESLEEVRGEREALRETIKVLSGAEKEAELAQAEDEAEAEGPESSGIPGIRWDPTEVSRAHTPNLDKHYAALRRSIHHVVDGPTPDPSMPASPMSGASTARDEPEGSSPPEAGPQLPGAFGPPALDNEPNPWASNGSPVVV